MTPLDKTCLPRENVLIQIEDDPPPQKKKILLREYTFTINVIHLMQKTRQILYTFTS